MFWQRWNWKQLRWLAWRERAFYILASLFAAWHTVAIAFAPIPENDNVTMKAHRQLFQPYLSLLSLDNPWEFFAPVSTGYVFRYDIVDEDGKKHTLIPTDEMSWFHPISKWFEDIHTSLWNDPDLYGPVYIAWLCKRYVALRPSEISLVTVQEDWFKPEDHLAGKNPISSEFVTEKTLASARCAGARPSRTRSRPRLRPRDDD